MTAYHRRPSQSRPRSQQQHHQQIKPFYTHIITELKIRGVIISTPILSTITIASLVDANYLIDLFTLRRSNADLVAYLFTHQRLAQW